MAEKSAIEWTEATLNPWTGCAKVSAGCAKCYISRTPPFRTQNRDWVRGKIPLVFHMERLEKMVRKTKPTMYFVNSLSDLFHEDAHDQLIADVFAAMARAPQHTFQVLTKRPSRMRKLLNSAWIADYVDATLQAYGLAATSWPLPNVWLGVSIENRRFVSRADVLRETPAAIRFVSAEPLLGPLVPDLVPSDDIGTPRPDWAAWKDGRDGDGLDLTGIDWLIVGGESGPGARRFDPRWARDLLRATRCDRCKGQGGRPQIGLLPGELDEILWCSKCGLKGYVTAFFMKQLGGARPGTKLEDLPRDLRVREFPEVAERPVEGTLF